MSFPVQPESNSAPDGVRQQKGQTRVLGSLWNSGEADQNEVVLESEPEVNEVFFTSEGLEQIEQRAKSGELNLALAMLHRIEEQPLSTSSAADRFQLNEWEKALEINVYFQLGQYSEVVARSKAFLSQWSGGVHFYQVYFQYAQALVAQKEPLESTSLVDEDFISHLSVSDAATLRGLLINDALSQGKIYEAFGYLEVHENQVIEGYDRWAGLIIDRFDSHDDIDELIERYEGNQWLAARLKVRKVQLWARTGDFDQAQTYLNELLGKEELDPKLYAEFVALGSFVENARATEPFRIGVILPFSHRNFGALARQVREGLEIGLAQFSNSERPIELVFKDSARDTSGAARSGKDRRSLIGELVRELVVDDKVIAILGPLAKGTSIAAGEAAEVYKIPVISFSLTEGLGSQLPYLFRYQRNDLDEAKSIAHYALDYLQAKRFVVLYHPNKNGFRRMEAFVNEVKRKGGLIVGVRPIRSKQVDFQEDFLSFTGGFEPVSDEDRAEIAKTRDRLAPQVDFDAIYAPVSPYMMNILSQFSSLFDADRSYFLAGHEMNQIENQLIESSSHLRFADSYPISGVNTYLLPLFEEHWRLYNHNPRYRPPTAYGIYGYESLEILSQLLNNPKNHNREVLRDALSQLHHFKVLSGEVTAQANGELYKPAKILEIKGNNTVEAF